MTLDNLYLNVDRKAADYRITIGGVILTNVASVSYSFAVQKVPTASIRIRGSLPANVLFNASVEIEEGFIGAARQRVFTGTVLHPDNSDATGITIECQGMSACLDNAYHKVIVTVDGSRTVPELIEDLLALSGALAYSVNMPDWTAGAVVPQTLSFQTYGEAITKLAEVNGGRWFETPTGVIKVEPKDPIPSLSAWRTYFSMTLTGIAEGYPAGIATGRPRLRRCGQVRRAREVKNQVWVRGAVLTNVNPDGSESSVTLEEHAFAPSPWVLNPDGSQAYNDELYSNEIIDDAVVAGLEAGRRVGVKNRLLTQVDVEIDGDPQVQTGVTVGIEDPSYSAVTGRWFVEALTTTLSAGHYSTSLSLLGGPQAGGQINIVPFANFLYSIEQEIMGDRVWDIVTFDGSPSIDPDGHIDKWCWTDNQTPMKASGCGETWTTRIDPTGIVAPWEVTLTVEDNDGNIDDLMLSIPYQSTEPDVWIPSLFVAFDTAASASPDGGINWHDQAIAGKSVISTSAKPADGVNFGIGVFGTADGCIYRTTDFCATAPTLVQAALGYPIEHLWWDINTTNIVWGITRNGKVLWSWDDGLTWAVYDDLAAIFGLTNIRLARIGTPVAGGVWIFGGTGTGYPLICWDAVVGGHSWTGATLGGELLADLTAGGLGSAGPVGFQVARIDRELLSYSPGDWAELSTTVVDPDAGTNYMNRLKNLGGTLFRFNHNGNPLVGVGTLQRSPDGGVTWSTVFARSTELCGPVDIARGSDGIMWMIWTDWDHPGTVYPRVYRSPDDGVTWNLHYTWTQYGWFYSIDVNPANPLQIVIGAGSSSPANRRRTVYSANGGGSWTTVTPVPDISMGGTSTWGSQTLFGTGSRIVWAFDADIMIRVSDDWGATWTPTFTYLPGTPYMLQMIRGSSASEFFVAQYNSGLEGYIMRSTDNGDTWDEDWATESGIGLNIYANSLAWDEVEGALYCMACILEAPPAICAAKWTAAVGWIDATADLFAESSYDTYTGERGLCAPVAAGAGSELYVAHAANRGDALCIILNSATHAPAVYTSASGGLGDGSDWKRAIGDAGALAKSRGKWIDLDLTMGHYVLGFDDNAAYRMDVAAGVGTISAAPANFGLNKGNYCQSLAWYENIDQSYLVAAEALSGTEAGFIYKTWDRFGTVALVRPATGFAAPPAGAKAKMIAFGAPGTALASAHLLIAGQNHPTTTTRFVAKKSGLGNWTSTNFAAWGANGRERVFALTPTNWFLIDSPGGPHYGSDTTTYVKYTKTAGAAWADLARPTGGDYFWVDFAIDAGGRLWGLALDTDTETDSNYGCTRLYYSDDQGDTWTLAQEWECTSSYANVYKMCHVVCHPTDQNIMAILGWGNIYYKWRTLWSVDRGLTFTKKDSSANDSYDDLGFQTEPVMTAASRLVWVTCSAASGDSHVKTTDDQGATWTVRFTFGSEASDSLGTVGLAHDFLGSKIFVGQCHSGDSYVGQVWFSLDQATTWAKFDNDPPYGTNHVLDGGLAYDDATDSLFVLNVEGTLNVALVEKMSPVLKAGSWADVTDSLLPLGADTHFEQANCQGIAVIPR